MGSVLHDYDRQLAGLRKRFPGWKIWYVPKTDQGVTWCAHPLPILNEKSPDDLAAAMAARVPEL